MLSRSQLLLLWVALAMPFTLASAQVQVLRGMPITASGTVSTAYVHSTDSGGMDDLNLGTNWDIDGYYFNPNFLHFQLSPYYDLGREFSQTEFVTGGKGIGASLAAFAGSSIPLIINYHRAQTSETTYNLPGSPHGIGGTGTTQDLSVNWTLRLRRLPTLQLTYLKNDGSFTVLGSTAQGGSQGSGYGISSQYALLGFLLTGSYNSNSLAQSLPNLFTNVPLSIDTRQKNLRFGVSRTLGHSTYFDSSASRSDWTSDATGRMQDRSFDSATASLSTRFTPKLSANVHVNYASDLVGLRLSSLLSGTPTTETGGLIPIGVATDSRFKFLDYSEGAAYNPGHGIRLQTTAQQATGSDTSGASTHSSLLSANASYERKLFGGFLNLGYGLGHSDTSSTSGNSGTASTSSGVSSQSGSTVGQSGSLGYTRQVGMWRYNGAIQYSQSSSQSTLLLSTRSYGGDLGVQGRVHGWHLTADARLNKTASESVSSHTDLEKNFRIALARGPLSLAASQQFSNGLSIVTATGLRSVPVTDPLAVDNLLSNLITPTISRSSAFSLTYKASVRLELEANWIKTQYETMLTSSTRGGLNDQLDISAKYHLRQLDCRAGYLKYLQQISGVANQFSFQSVYFQVSRRINLF